MPRPNKSSACKCAAKRNVFAFDSTDSGRGLDAVVWDLIQLIRVAPREVNTCERRLAELDLEGQVLRKLLRPSVTEHVHESEPHIN